MIDGLAAAEIARHEAGHAVAAWAMGRTVVSVRMWWEDGGGLEGFTPFYAGVTTHERKRLHRRTDGVILLAPSAGGLFAADRGPCLADFQEVDRLLAGIPASPERRQEIRQEWLDEARALALEHDAAIELVAGILRARLPDAEVTGSFINALLGPPPRRRRRFVTNS
ncbi:MAG: hypothetical protein M3450_05770 [Actinomycetota bacterium]|nr:hypothetical protein [Actinomycetota bacterium]